MSDPKVVMLRNVRGSFLNLFQPKPSDDGGAAKYNGAFILEADVPETEDNLTKIDTAMKTAAKEKWGAKAADIFKSLKAGGKLALKDGDTKAEYAGFAGNMFFSASNAVKPTLVDNVLDPSTRKPRRLDESDGKVYSGAYFNVKVAFWAQDNKYGKRINAELQGVQFHADGERFGGGGAVASEDDFEAEEMAATADADPFGDDDIPF